ncbi:MAG: hypothetical protein V3V91_01190 [Thermoplasmata archaeon]
MYEEKVRQASVSDWESKRDEEEESEERKILTVEKAENEWIKRE